MAAVIERNEVCLYSYGVDSYGMQSYGLYGNDLCSYGLYGNDLCRYGFGSYGASYRP